MAGLTAAAYLARAGVDVLLLEKTPSCGGLVNTFERDGFRFEGGARALVSAGILQPMMRELGIELQTVKNAVSVGLEDRIMHVTGEDSLEAYADLLRHFYPESTADIARIMHAIRQVMQDMRVLYGVSNPLFNNFKEDLGYFLKVYTPWFFKFLRTVRRINQMQQPVEAYLDKLTHNRSLRDIISQHFFKNTPAFFALSYFYLYNDYFYPKGGVGKLPQALQDKLRAYGGALKTSTTVTAVHAAARQLLDQHGQRYAYDHLIWTADLKTLYRITDPTGLPERAAAALASRKTAILAGRGADSVLTVYAAVDEPPETFQAISNGHFFYTPSRQGLGETHRAELRDLLARWDTLSQDDILAWLDRFCQLTTYEISIPALKDPEAAPPGQTGLIISTLFEYDLVEKIAAAGWYDTFKTAVEQRMLDILSATIYPGLKAKVRFTFSATPLTIARTFGSSEGAIVGWSFEAPLPVAHKMLSINDAVKTAIPHVIQAGQWAYSPTGVPTAVLTGRLAAQAVEKRKKI